MRKLFLVPSVVALVVMASGCLYPPPAIGAWTVADNYRPLRYSASIGQNNFNVTWVFESKSDLRVQVSDDDGVTWTTKTLDVDYTVTGAGVSGGGQISFVDDHCDDREGGCTAGTLVVIYRDDGIDRTVDFTTLTPTGVDTHMDRQTVQLQQVEDIAQNRALQVPVSDDYAGSGFSPVLPPIVADHAGKGVVLEDDLSGFDYVDFGDVDGPASSTDNAVPRFDGTNGKQLQNSAVIISDANAVSGVSALTVSGSGTFGGTVAVAGTVAATTVTGANVTSGADPGHTHSGAAITDGSIGAADLAPNSVGLEELAACEGTGNEVVQYASNGTPTCTIAGGDVTGSYASLQLAAGSVGAAEIAANAVVFGKIANNAVGQSEIMVDGVSSSEIAADAVKAAEIDTGAVGSDEIATDAVGSAEIAANAVGSVEIADGAVTNLKIADGTIVAADFSVGAVDENAIGTGAVTSDKIPADAITAAKIADNAVGLEHLAACEGTGNEVVQFASNGTPTCTIAGGDVTGSYASLQLAAGSVGLTEIDNLCEGTGNEVVQFASNGTPTCTIAGGDVTGSYGNLAIGTGKVTTGKILDNTITVADINAGEVFEVDGVNGGQIAYGGDSTQEDLILVANTAAWSLVTGTIAANNAILWTSVESGQTAVNGAQTRVSILHRTSDGALDVTVTGSDIFITTERASGVNVTTAADVIAAVNADGSANALVLADDYSTSNGTGVVTETNTASAATQGLVPLHGDGNIFFGAAADNGYNTASYDMRSGRLLIGLAEPLNLDAEGRAEATATGGLEVQNTSAGVEAEKGVMRLIARTTSAGTLTGYGVFTGVFADNSVGTIKGMGKENWTWTDPTDGSEDAIWSLDLKNAGTDNADVIYVDGTGVVRAKTGFKINSGFASCDHIETDSTGLMTCIDDPAGTFTYNPGSLGALGSELNPFTCTGGLLGDTLVVAPGNYLTGMMISAQVGAADLCYVTLFNPSGGAIDAASSTWTWKILR